MTSSVTVQAWIDGGASQPEVTVTLAPSDHDGLHELSIHHTGGDFSLTGVLLDPDSLQHLLKAAIEQTQATQPATVVDDHSQCPPDAHDRYEWDYDGLEQPPCSLAR